MCGLAFSTLGKDRLVTPMGKGIYQRRLVCVVESFDHIIQALYRISEYEIWGE